MQLELMPNAPRDAIEDLTLDPSLSQWMTPAWAAEMVVEIALGEATETGVILEPSCGTGRLLAAIPNAIEAIGVEIDPRLADVASKATGRQVVIGDFRTVRLPVTEAALLVANPPFDMEVFDGMANRAHDILVQNGRMVAILPAYAFQTSSRVLKWNSRWTLHQRMMPRTVFPGISLPLVLATFIKETERKLFGFILYNESRCIEEMPASYAEAARKGANAWKAVVERALSSLGGQASLRQIYAEIEPRRPTGTEFWKEKVRQQLSLHFPRVGVAEYSLAEAA